ncbi:hypothetical protein SAMN02745146_0382 [Hymenobacter daecheongensis DSM 21074]|uniref:Uncharacterized protein n=1 Tax=Hymenobacter daecheongensis DSM 21074 TaxID=1121955 RepID=A0A1M5ZY34_9BACT|nr:hypothetical protein [Hymenobacter daecheongensis]SHI29150.1 hypothetical protein SAMN02745146_0382 [Hymenobacter daecheongensis DSM 21074]
MRFPLLRLLPLLWLLVSCSEQKTANIEHQKPAARTTPDSVAAAPSRPSAAPAAADTTAVQDVAAYLAGMPVSRTGELRDLVAQPAWQAFAIDADKSWASYHQTRTDKIRPWAAAELDSARQAAQTVFYPFSGPDFLNVATMFPTSQTYVLIGLEPVGSVPRRATLENPRLFPALKASLWSVLNFSFFRTNDMAVDLKSVELDGSLPLLMLFAARTGHQVTAIRYVQLNTQGQLLDADTATIRKPGPKIIPGVEMQLLNESGQKKQLYYFSADLSDWKLGTNKEAALKYVRTLGPLVTYVKSATYLMHKTYFSKVRNLILEQSSFVLQDDSGIAMKYFRPADWQFTYYGVYKRPINLFAKQYQPELTKAYADSAHRPRPLPFGTGYNWRQNDSNLLLARRRSAPAM